MPAYNRELEKFAGMDAQVVGISVDSIFSHQAWQRHQTGMLGYPLLSDFWPHGEVARRYGVLREQTPYPGISERSIFIIDKPGKVAFSRVYHLGQLPPLEDIYETLEKLQRG